MALIDICATAVVLILLAAIATPALERARELSKRTVCAVNLKTLGGAGHVYADANKGQWMIPSFSNRAVFGTGAQGIDYLCKGDGPDDLMCVGFERAQESRSETPLAPAAGSTAVTTTRAYWMLVRSGDVSVEQFVCPSSSVDSPDATEQIELYYDFTDYHNISYGYLVPFGPPDTKPRPGADNRVVLAADKGPYYQNVLYDYMTAGPNGVPLQKEHAPMYWKPFNSRNHSSGTSWSEGQNVLRADGNVEFLRKPLGGADSDNIYALMGENWDAQLFNLIHGYSPHQSPAYHPYPGKEAFGTGPNGYSTTDSLIYP